MIDYEKKINSLINQAAKYADQVVPMRPTKRTGKKGEPWYVWSDEDADAWSVAFHKKMNALAIERGYRKYPR